MRTVQREEILPDEEFVRQRDQRRQEIVELKRRRRVSVGPFVSLVFENRRTVWWQIQEMLHAERASEESKLREEIEVYNALLPREGELSATMLIEIGDVGELRAWLPRLVSIEHSVSFRIGEQVVRGVAEQGRSEEERTSTVHYVRFPLPPELRGVLASQPAEIAVEHPHYTYRSDLPRETADELEEDLRAPG